LGHRTAQRPRPTRRQLFDGMERIRWGTERDKMLAGELYDPMDPELVRARDRARDLCQDLNATREA
jgi:hypothetical protein